MEDFFPHVKRSLRVQLLARWGGAHAASLYLSWPKEAYSTFIKGSNKTLAGNENAPQAMELYTSCRSVVFLRDAVLLLYWTQKFGHGEGEK